MAAPYSNKESGESSNSTGLTSELKDKTAIASWVSKGAEERPVSAGSKGGSSKQRGAAQVAGLVRNATMRVSGNISGKWTAREPEMVQCMLERDKRGVFGMGLNDHNRVTHTVPGSSAEKAGLQVATASARQPAAPPIMPPTPACRSSIESLNSTARS